MAAGHKHTPEEIGTKRLESSIFAANSLWRIITLMENEDRINGYGDIGASSYEVKSKDCGFVSDIKHQRWR